MNYQTGVFENSPWKNAKNDATYNFTGADMDYWNGPDNFKIGTFTPAQWNTEHNSCGIQIVTQSNMRTGEYTVDRTDLEVRAIMPRLGTDACGLV